MSDYFASADELYLALVQSSKAHAEIVDVDWSDALKVAGVVGKVDAGDVPASNVTGLRRDEEVFRSKTVRVYISHELPRVRIFPFPPVLYILIHRMLPGIGRRGSDFLRSPFMF